MSTLKVATYNINRYGLDQKRMMRIAVQAGKLDADLLGFQEYTLPMLTALRDTLPPERYGLYQGYQYEDLWHHPVFWRREALELVPGSTATQYLGEFPQLPCQHREAATVRMASSLVLQLVDGKRRLLVANLQLDNRSQAARLEGVRQLLRYPCSAWPKLPALLLGDFNYSTAGPLFSQAMAAPHRLLTEEGNGFIDCWEQAHPGQACPATFHAGKGTQAPVDPFGCYNPDHIYVRGLQVEDCQVVVEPDDRLSSDHYPVTTTVTFLE